MDRILEAINELEASDENKKQEVEKELKFN